MFRMNALLRTVGRDSTIFSKFQAFSEKLKGGRFEKIGFYWKGVYLDYKEAVLDAVRDARAKPKKSIAITTALGVAWLAAKTVPDENAFRHRLLINANRILLVSDELRNPEASRHVQVLADSYNKGLVRFINLGLFSVIWIDDHDRENALYAAQCTYLKPKYSDFHKRIVDVGAFGTWHLIERKFRDYDVNPNEWIQQSSSEP